MLRNTEHVELPFNFRMVDQSLKTLYYGQGDNSVKVDIVHFFKIAYLHLIQHLLPSSQISKICEHLPISSKIIGKDKPDNIVIF